MTEKTSIASSSALKSDEDLTEDVPENSGSSDEDSEDDESSNSEPIQRKAPLQLLVETVAALVRKEYAVARKLCQMILIYEPGHQRATDLMGIIDEKQRLEAEAAAAAQDDDGNSQDSSDDDDDSEDDDADDDDDNDEEGSSSFSDDSDGSSSVTDSSEDTSKSVAKTTSLGKSVSDSIRPLSTGK